MKMDFDGSIKLEFHDARVTSNSGLLAYNDLDYALLASQPPCKIIKTGAKIIRYSIYVTFQMAEVMIDKGIFAGILSRIERLLYYSV